VNIDISTTSISITHDDDPEYCARIRVAHISIDIEISTIENERLRGADILIVCVITDREILTGEIEYASYDILSDWEISDIRGDCSANTVTYSSEGSRTDDGSVFRRDDIRGCRSSDISDDIDLILISHIILGSEVGIFSDDIPIIDDIFPIDLILEVCTQIYLRDRSDTHTLLDQTCVKMWERIRKCVDWGGNLFT